MEDVAVCPVLGVVRRTSAGASCLSVTWTEHWRSRLTSSIRQVRLAQLASSSSPRVRDGSPGCSTSIRYHVGWHSSSGITPSPLFYPSDNGSAPARCGYHRQKHHAAGRPMFTIPARARGRKDDPQFVSLGNPSPAQRPPPSALTDLCHTTAPPTLGPNLDHHCGHCMAQRTAALPYKTSALLGVLITKSPSPCHPLGCRSRLSPAFVV